MRILKATHWNKFYIARDKNVWGNNRKRFSNWSNGEKLLMFIENDGIALFEITGEQYYSEEILWEDDIYQWRIPITLLHMFDSQIGKEKQKLIKNILQKNFGSHYGSILICGTLVPKNVEFEILNVIK